MSLVDEISPSYVATELIKLQLADPDAILTALSSLLLDVTYTDTDQYGGTVLPLELTITSPSAENFYRQVFTKVIPPQLAITPKEGGQHLVLLREIGHNRAYGKITLEVEGILNDESVAEGQSA